MDVFTKKNFQVKITTYNTFRRASVNYFFNSILINKILYFNKGTKKYAVFYNSPSDTEKVFRLDHGRINGVLLESITRLREEAGMMDSFSNLNGEEWYKVSNAIVLA